jgi:hypothetical protein
MKAIVISLNLIILLRVFQITFVIRKALTQLIRQNVLRKANANTIENSLSQLKIRRNIHIKGTQN